MSRIFDPERALRVLVASDVAFIVSGAVAVAFWGSPWLIPILEIYYEQSRRNCDALANALRKLSVRPSTEELMGLEPVRLETDAGVISCVGTGYENFRSGATKVEVGDIGDVWIASLDDIILARRSRGYPVDRWEAEMLETLKRQAYPSSPS